MLNDDLFNKGKKDLVKRFSDPSVAFRGKPFWAWNGELEEKELLRQVDVLEKMGFGGFFMHSRMGLATEYLGEEWFRLTNVVADEGARRGMEAWLYDEDRWPSGSAGGKATIDPRFRMKILFLSEHDPERFIWAEDTCCTFLAKVDGLNLYSYRLLQKNDDIHSMLESYSEETKMYPGVLKILYFHVVESACDSNFNGTTYLDAMNPKATEKFIELTHEGYLKHCGERLGAEIKGIFTDEPERGCGMDSLFKRDGFLDCPMCWTDDFFERFEMKYGYDATAVLPELFYHYREQKIAPVKLHYIDLANNLFLERFFIPINKWCIDHGMEFTGHAVHEDSLTAQAAPTGSIMRCYEHMGYPGIDVLWEENSSYWIVKQLASVARQTGKHWMLSELYGCTGWQMDFKGHKTIGDWQALFGINVRCPHLSWYTMEGESKRDCPGSIMQQAYCFDYEMIESYFSRFGTVMTEGTPNCDVLVLNPIESVWCQMYAGWANFVWCSYSPEINLLEQHYAKLFHILAGNHIDFDYGEEDIMSRTASVDHDAENKAVLCVGKMKYHVVVVSGMITIRPSSLRLLKEFMAAGGTVIFSGDVPPYVDAVLSDEPSDISKWSNAIKIPFEEKALSDTVKSVSSYSLSISTEDGKPAENVFCQTRHCEEDGIDFIALVNVDRKNDTGALTLKIPDAMIAGSVVEEWDLLSGIRYQGSFMKHREGSELIVSLSLPAGGTIVLAFTKQVDLSLPVKSEKKLCMDEITTVVSDDMTYELKEENVCVLDFTRWRWNEGEWKEEQEVLKADRAIRDFLKIERRGGSMMQPWYAKNLDNKEYGQLELEYEFFLDEIPEHLTLAGERPDNNSYSVNGVQLYSLDPDSFWVDACFKRMDIPKEALKLGKNTVTVKTTFKRTTNVEALYLLGMFGVEIKEGRQKNITSLCPKIPFGDIKSYRLPFYSGSLVYHVTPEQYKAFLSGKELKIIASISFKGALVKIYPMGQPESAKRIGWDPYEADITDWIKQGLTLCLELVCTRRSTFGPLHLLPMVYKEYGPAQYVTEGDNWSDEYMLLESGILEFRIKV